MSEDSGTGTWRSIGQRNVLYLGFIALLGPLSLALDGPRLNGTESWGGIPFATMLCVLVSVVFLVVNSGFLVADLAKGRRAAKALLGCALPVLFGGGALMLRGSVW